MEEIMKDGLKAIISLFLAFAIMVPVIILCAISGWGLLSAFIFTPIYYLLAWKMKMLRNADGTFMIHGIIPVANVMGAYALLIIFIHDRILNADLNVFLSKKRG